MKTTPLIATCVVLLTMGTAALACDHCKTKDTTKTKAKTAKVEPAKRPESVSSLNNGSVLLTGSYTRQNIRRTGQITDGSSQVIVLDRATIERSGASDVKQLLVHQGIH